MDRGLIIIGCMIVSTLCCGYFAAQSILSISQGNQDATAAPNPTRYDGQSLKVVRVWEDQDWQHIEQYINEGWEVKAIGTMSTSYGTGMGPGHFVVLQKAE